MRLTMLELKIAKLLERVAQLEDPTKYYTPTNPVYEKECDSKMADTLTGIMNVAESLSGLQWLEFHIVQSHFNFEYDIDMIFDSEESSCPVCKEKKCHATIRIGNWEFSSIVQHLVADHNLRIDDQDFRRFLRLLDIKKIKLPPTGLTHHAMQVAASQQS